MELDAIVGIIAAGLIILGLIIGLVFQSYIGVGLFILGVICIIPAAIINASNTTDAP